MAFTVWNIFFDVIIFIRIIVATLLTILGIPFALILFLPIYLCRFIVSQLRKVFRPDLARMVVTRSSIMAVDFWNGIGGQPKCNLVLTMCFEGHLDIEKLVVEMTDKLLDRREENGELSHPECRQYFERWLGFMFWKWEENMDVRKHIRYYYEENPNHPVNSKDLLRIEGELTGKPFPESMSPWEVLVIPNYQPDDFKSETHKSALIFRLHHGIADGYSLLNLLLREICQLYKHEYALPQQHKKIPLCRRILDGLVFAIRSPFEAVQQQVGCRDYNEWRIPESRLSENWFHGQTKPIPLEYIKEIKRANNVSFTAVLVAALSGGIRNYLIKRGRPVPRKMHSLAPFPMQDRIHTTKLRNFYTYAFLKFPVGTACPRMRLKETQKYLDALKTATTPLTNFWQIPIFGGLFAPMIKPLVKNCVSTAVMSNFPGPNERCHFLGNPVIEMGHAGGLVHGNTGIGFAMLSYLGKLTIRSRGSQSIFPSEAHIDDLLNEVCLELGVLSKLEKDV